MTDIRIIVPTAVRSTSSESADFFVSLTGDDSDGLTPATAKITIMGGVNLLSAGQKVLVFGGNYNEVMKLDSGSCANGTSDINRTTIKANPGDTVTNRAVTSGQVQALLIKDRQWLDIDGISFNGSDHSAGQNQGDGVKLDPGCQHVLLQNFTVSNYGLDAAGDGRGGQGIIDVSKPSGSPAGGSGAGNGNEFLNLIVHTNGLDGAFDHGIYIQGHGNITHDCEVYNNAAIGLHFFAGNGNRTDDNNIQYNDVHDNGRTTTTSRGSGILVGGDDNLIANNLSYDNDGRGLDAFGDASNNIWANNTVYNNANAAYRTGNNSVGETFINNIFYLNAAKEDNGTDTVETTNLFTNPFFVDAPNDFHLTASSTDAIDSGTALSEVTDDFERDVRDDPPDIGAYEFP